ncbi:MAG TPA: alpha/beta hydrolase [Ruminiclostridium sp.]|uniref:Alpha/beta hydrolase family protein n=1 Tax=Acetivibrio saccincola TaxID=1677857 RepID=A0A2K9EGU4_9FIRM|nr:alpha/beta hydrolase [Acetivibrio saccincola]HAA43152.1 alpha/beta hydrolase [Ruminiclostridium sp.]AUG57143.1 Alpha/beta hydrolase family protein [Acetivibrio saccincola]AUG58861.1 Alpha/beta hydrolase family protein [Acetivibrio saccincola]HOA97181.1 alpha/beta hydrolase [Acetivibrio saccincola]HQD29775.1 alpha/beta hydrolase [Acetivibrio saccincola]
MRISGISYTQRKRQVPKKLILVVILLITLTALIISIISIKTAMTLTKPERSELPVFSANIVPEYDSISFRDINNEVTLKGWFFISPESNKTIILAHGYGSNRLPFGEDTIGLIKSFLNEGYNLMTFDFRNSGESEGDVTSVGYFEKSDLLGAIEYAKKRGSDEIVLLGFSMGASTAILAAAESQDVDAVIADSPFSDLTSYLDENLSVWSNLPSFFNKTTLFTMKLLTGVDTKDVSPVNEIGKIYPRPVLLIHSTDDELIPVKHSYILKEASGDNVELWETSGASHIKTYKEYPDEYIKKVLDFINNSIKGEDIEDAENS